MESQSYHGILGVLSARTGVQQCEFLPPFALTLAPPSAAADQGAASPVRSAFSVHGFSHIQASSALSKAYGQRQYISRQGSIAARVCEH